jgi:hypothetical protein
VSPSVTRVHLYWPSLERAGINRKNVDSATMQLMTPIFAKRI